MIVLELVVDMHSSYTISSSYRFSIFFILNKFGNCIRNEEFLGDHILWLIVGIHQFSISFEGTI